MERATNVYGNKKGKVQKKARKPSFPKESMYVLVSQTIAGFIKCATGVTLEVIMALI